MRLKLIETGTITMMNLRFISAGLEVSTESLDELAPTRPDSLV